MPSALETCQQPVSELSRVTSQGEPLLLRAFKGEKLERPPVWMMRQAGRYMHEYQAVRQRVSFLEICKTPDLAVEVTLQPLKAFGFDASIIFSDILIPLEAMGLHLEVTDGKGPVFTEPLRHTEDLKRFNDFKPLDTTPFLAEALQRMRRELEGTGITLIGFAGAPWTLASYAIEGTSWKTGRYMKAWLMEDPTTVRAIMDKLTANLIPYLRMQADAGAQVLMLFDTWAGQVPDLWYDEWVAHYHRQIIQALKSSHPEVPIILFAKQARDRLNLVAATGADCVSVDEWTPLDVARERVGPGVTLQGNLDSSALFVQDEAVLKRLTHETLRRGGSTQYIFNLGHGVLPQTPRENVARVVDWVKNWQTD